MTALPEQPHNVERGIPPNPGVPFNVDLIDRLYLVNNHIRTHIRLANQKKNTPDAKYERYIADICNEEKGFLVAEGLVYQAVPANQEFFQATIQEDESVVVLFPNINAQNKSFKTVTTLKKVRMPGVIETSEQAREYIEGPAIPEPLNITHQRLVETGGKIEAINDIERNADRSKDAERIQDFLRLKDLYIDQILLPARRGKLPQNCEIRVELLKDPKGRSQRDIVRVIIRASNNIYITNTLTPYNRKDEKGRPMQKQIGTYDFEGETKI